MASGELSGTRNLSLYISSPGNLKQLKFIMIVFHNRRSTLREIERAFRFMYINNMTLLEDLY